MKNQEKDQKTLSSERLEKNTKIIPLQGNNVPPKGTTSVAGFSGVQPVVPVVFMRTWE